MIDSELDESVFLFKFARYRQSEDVNGILPESCFCNVIILIKQYYAQ